MQMEMAWLVRVWGERGNEMTWEKTTGICSIILVFFTFVLIILTYAILFEIPKVREDIKKVYSVNINQPINIADNVDVYAIRSRDKSIIKFDVPNEMIKEGIFNTICYIENTEEGNSMYVIGELNLTTPRLELNEKYKFLCQIEEGVISKVLKN